MESIQLPPPPKSLVIQRWARSVGILLLGVAGIITSITTSAAFETLVHNREVSACRVELTNAATSAEGELSAAGWTAALDLRNVKDQEVIDRKAAELHKLADAYRKAQDRRNRTNEICGE